ncbi:MAG: NAD(+) synthase [Prevotellaceae bacterium]|jgi:NAD+ synthase (glutamine-hydrolysing)|nr:NAD(+) synthase [Prevotellaceae bacterium]
MNHGFLKVAAAIPEVKVADCEFNSSRIMEMIRSANAAGVEIICFPELALTSYTCGDLFFQELLLESAKIALVELVEYTSGLDIICIVGLPLMHGDRIFNVAAVFGRGAIYGFVPKTYLPNYNEYYEKRWFSSAGDITGREIYFDIKPVKSIDRAMIQYSAHVKKSYPFTPDIVFGDSEIKFAIEICEDLWVPNPPSGAHCMAGAHVVFNLSASNELTGKHQYRKALAGQQSARCMAGYVYSGSGWGESTTDIVFSGNAMIFENGVLLNEAERFSFSEQIVVSDIDIDRLRALRAKNTSFGRRFDENRMFAPVDFPERETKISRYINPGPFVPASGSADESLNDIFSIQVGGLAKRLVHTGIRKQVIGISGGLDSTLALLVCVKTCDKLKIPRSNIIGVTMPGFGTSGRTYRNAMALMRELDVTVREIDISKACNRHFKDIGHDPDVHNVTYENTQARERTQILMDIANQCSGIVIGTGDLSELALGWTTYNGDHMSMYAVNVSIPKTLVKHLVFRFADTLSEKNVKKIFKNILDTPISPELLPAGKNRSITQSTEEIVGPYELHDFFLYYLLRLGYSPSKIFFMAKIAFEGIYDNKTILKWMEVFYKRFFTQQFKRSCLPDGPKVGSVNLSPRGDWRMPSDGNYTLWMKNIDELKTGAEYTELKD